MTSKIINAVNKSQRQARGSDAFSRRYKLSSYRLRHIYIRLHAEGIIFRTRESAQEKPKARNMFPFSCARLCYALLGALGNVADKNIGFNDTRA